MGKFSGLVMQRHRGAVFVSRGVSRAFHPHPWFLPLAIDRAELSSRDFSIFWVRAFTR